MYAYNITPTHINNIKIGDTIIENGHMKTISKTNLNKDCFMGRSINGYNYKCGQELVQRVDLCLAKDAKYYSIAGEHNENNLIVHDKDLIITE